MQKLPPAVAHPDIAGRRGQPGQGRGERQRNPVAAGRKQHLPSLVVADPGRVAHAAVEKMRGEQRIDTIVARLAFERREDDVLQHGGARRIGQDALFDPVCAVRRGVGQAVGRNAAFDGFYQMPCVALLLGEVVSRTCDDQPEIARAGAVHPWVIDFVENAVADGEPDTACRRKSGADAAFGARRPARRYPPGVGRHPFIGHCGSSWRLDFRHCGGRYSPKSV